MRKWRRHLRITRPALVFAVAALLVPTAQAGIATNPGATASSTTAYAGLPHPGEADYARYGAFAQDKIELVRVEPRNGDRALDSVEFVRAAPRTTAPDIELVRLQPRNTTHALDNIELVRVAPQTGSPEVAAAPGFDWGDAGIGAGVMAGFALLGLGAAAATRRLRPVAA